MDSFGGQEERVKLVSMFSNSSPRWWLECHLMKGVLVPAGMLGLLAMEMNSYHGWSHY